MELNFQNQTCSYLDIVLRDVQNYEQTQEIKLSEGMPDVSKILTAWGQPILRGKEWDNDTLTCNGGMMVWILYAPEDGTQERCVEGWIPFPMHWELPDDTPEGTMRLRLLPRPVDARSISPRKILVRAGMGTLMEVYSPKEANLAILEHEPQGVEVLNRTYPLRLVKEAGEKGFAMDEELKLSDSAPIPEQIISYRAEPSVFDKKVLSGKIIFRGIVDLHILYRGEDGIFHCEDFEMPFSQYGELTGEYGQDAIADFALCVTSMDLEISDGQQFRFKCGIAAQYTVAEREQVSLIEDAYALHQEFVLKQETLEMPMILEDRKESVYISVQHAQEAGSLVEEWYMPDFPRQRLRENGIDTEFLGTYQALYYGSDGVLKAYAAKWDAALKLNASSSTELFVVPGRVSGGMKSELPLDVTVFARQKFQRVSGISLGEERKAEPSRPSLILKRTGKESLWEIAKSAHSTVQSIKEANSLQNEPSIGQLLLIPVL